LREYSFPKSHRIKKRRDYIELSKSGNRIQDRYFIVLYKKNQLLGSRLGITVSKKVGGAVNRNRLKRIIREAYRLNRKHLTEHIDINIIVKKLASNIQFEIVLPSLKTILDRACEKK